MSMLSQWAFAGQTAVLFLMRPSDQGTGILCNFTVHHLKKAVYLHTVNLESFSIYCMFFGFFYVYTLIAVPDIM